MVLIHSSWDRSLSLRVVEFRDARLGAEAQHQGLSVHSPLEGAPMEKACNPVVFWGRLKALGNEFTCRCCQLRPLKVGSSFSSEAYRRPMNSDDPVLCPLLNTVLLDLVGHTA